VQEKLSTPGKNKSSTDSDKGQCKIRQIQQFYASKHEVPTEECILKVRLKTDGA
jgi:hypothetical protein